MMDIDKEQGKSEINQAGMSLRRNIPVPGFSGIMTCPKIKPFFRLKARIFIREKRYFS